MARPNQHLSPRLLPSCIIAKLRRPLRDVNDSPYLEVRIFLRLVGVEGGGLTRAPVIAPNPSGVGKPTIRALGEGPLRGAAEQSEALNDALLDKALLNHRKLQSATYVLRIGRNNSFM